LGISSFHRSKISSGVAQSRPMTATFVIALLALLQVPMSLVAWLELHPKYALKGIPAYERQHAENQQPVQVPPENVEGLRRVPHVDGLN